MLIREPRHYQYNQQNFEVCPVKPKHEGSIPVVMLTPVWEGLSQMYCRFADQMAAAKVDWQMRTCMVIRNMPLLTLRQMTLNRGTLYNPIAKQRSFKACQNFLKDIFSD